LQHMLEGGSTNEGCPRKKQKKGGKHRRKKRKKKKKTKMQKGNCLGKTFFFSGSIE